tara:strand:- start:191 stop:484 length:294 start_codon:yes stop_codon:yes gene_type:complete
MDYSILENKLLELLKSFILENEIEISSDISSNTRLIGSSSIFDSIELVTFIVEVEQFLQESFDIEVQLTSENAMSRRTSPFLSVAAMSRYIIEETNE